MNLIFHIEYRTNFGEELMLNLVSKSADGHQDVTVYRMTTYDGCRWKCEINMPKIDASVDYYYSVVKGEKTLRREWTLETHRLQLKASKGDRMVAYDHWSDIPDNAYLYSSAMTECVNRHAGQPLRTTAYPRTVRLKVRAPQLRRNERLAVTGEGPALGDWAATAALAMSEHNYNEWVVDVDASRVSGGRLVFKFVALDEDEDVTPLWELGDNRFVVLPEMNDGDVVVYELAEAHFPHYDVKCAGTLVPVFSLRSEGSFGVGDFGDLAMMVDWVAHTHQRVLQILPINDTTITHTWTDSYPYSCISIFALHPQYADLRQLPPLADEKLRAEMEETRQRLNALPQIDYEQVNRAKLRYLQAIFAQEGKQTMATPAFRQFFEDNKSWLVPYARYSQLREFYGTADFSRWPDHNTWDEAERHALSSTRTKAYKEVAFYYYVQFVLNVQMKAVHEHARERGVILKGDIPIGVNRHGCDVWQEPRYFHLDGQAGAPPDDFSANGQNWGFPTYNWEEMLSDGCAWWLRRFSNMQKYFDAYRIDHVLGFFRIWEIPQHSVHGLLGQFSPALPMSVNEIESYGLRFNAEYMTRPFITDWTLERVFGYRADLVKALYLQPRTDGRYNLKDEYSSQRKIEVAFANRADEDSISLRDGLYALASCVLFVPDHKYPEVYHPRISAQRDFVYESLPPHEQEAFNRLYNDYFFRRHNKFWYREAMKKLPILTQSTRMLVCAEDLGMVPDCVPWVMENLKILSLEIQTMPKRPELQFGRLWENPYRSVATISTHDMPPLRMWWDEDTERAQQFYNLALYKDGTAPHPAPGWLCEDIVAAHLFCPSVFTLLSLQDWLSIDENLRLADPMAERINIPANPRHYWRYRMHMTIEQLMNAHQYNEKVKSLIENSGRA